MSNEAFAARMEAEHYARLRERELASCPNPSCRGGYIPAGEKGDILCADCVREGRVKPKPVTMIGGPKP